MTEKIPRPRGRPYHIAVIGIDCSGKSAISEALKKKFNENGYNTDVIHFPKLKFSNETKFPGKQAKAFMDFLKEQEEKAQAAGNKNKSMYLWFIMALFHPFRKVTTSDKQIVFYDREPSIELRVYADIYDTPRLKRLSSIPAQPDLIIKLECKIKTAIERIEKSRETSEIHETKAALLKLDERYNYISYKTKKEVIHIHTDSSIEDACDRAYQELIKYLQLD